MNSVLSSITLSLYITKNIEDNKQADGFDEMRYILEYFIVDFVSLTHFD